MSQNAAAKVVDLTTKYRWFILIGLITAAIMEVLDTTIVNVSLPQIAGNIGATSEEIGWVSTGYILANVIILPVTAWLSSRFGRRKYLAASITIFTAASIMCGLSGSLIGLVFWRIVQGAGGAALLSTSQATIREIFPPEEQGMTQAIYILGIIVAPTIGPTLGGWITDNYSWHWSFFINLPIGIASFLLVTSFLQDSKYKMATGSVDWAGLGLLTIGIGALQYALEEGNSKQWFEDSTIVACISVAAISLPLFVLWELSKRNPVPIVNLRVLKNAQLSAGLILYLVLGFGLYGGVFVYPLFAQGILRLTPTETGLALFPGGLATAVSATIAGRLQQIPPRILIVTGLTGFLCSMIWLASLPPTSGVGDAQAALLLRGAGLGLLFVPINLAAFSTLKGPEIAQGAALLNLCRQMGGSFGIAILATYLTHQTAVSRGVMASHLNVGANPALTDRFNLASRLFMSRGYAPPLASKAADQLILSSLDRQASAAAFNQAFMLIAIAILVSTPAIFLLRNPKRGPAPAAVAADAH